jgi:uncharacterized membrane protein
MNTAAPTNTTSTELNVGDVLSRAWKLFTDKPAEHILAGLVVAIVGSLTLGILAGPLLVGYIRMIDRQSRGEAINVSQVFDGMNAFGSAFLASLIIGVCAFIGTLLLVLPGILVLLAWSLGLWFVALRGDSAMAALGASWRLFKTHLGPVLLMFLIFVVLNAAGSAVLFGTLFTFPFAVVVQTIAFRELTA